MKQSSEQTLRASARKPKCWFNPRLFILIIVLALLVIFAPNFAKIEKIECESQFGPCNKLVQDEIDSIERNDYKFAKDKLAEKLRQNFLVKEFSLQFIPPNVLKVNLLEKKAKFALASDAHKDFLLVDAEGEVLAKSSSTSLPVLTVSGELLDVGQKVDSETLFALNIIYDLYNSYQVSKGVINNDSLSVELLKGVKVIFPLFGDKELLLGGLNAIMNQLKSGRRGSKISLDKECVSGCKIDAECKNQCTIDLRFKNPVIR